MVGCSATTRASLDPARVAIRLSVALERAVPRVRPCARRGAAFKYDNRDRLQDALWDLRSMIGAMMCVYSADPDDFFSNMTDEAEKLAEPTDPESRP